MLDFTVSNKQETHSLSSLATKMSQPLSYVALFSLLSAVYGQSPGVNTPEVNPPITWQTCTTTGGCTDVQGGITIDANYRWTHNVRAV